MSHYSKLQPVCHTKLGLTVINRFIKVPHEFELGVLASVQKETHLQTLSLSITDL